VKDLKGKLKERVTEIDVLKEMVKSANMSAKAKDIDIKKLKNRLERQGGSRSRDHSEGSPQSRQSRMNRGGYAMDDIQERDPMLE
jgi:predicted RecB family endonuclease